jgi:hypothetical protein
VNRKLARKDDSDSASKDLTPHAVSIKADSGTEAYLLCVNLCQGWNYSGWCANSQCASPLMCMRLVGNWDGENGLSSIYWSGDEDITCVLVKSDSCLFTTQDDYRVVTNGGSDNLVDIGFNDATHSYYCYRGNSKLAAREESDNVKLAVGAGIDLTTSSARARYNKLAIREENDGPFSVPLDKNGNVGMPYPNGFIGTCIDICAWNGACYKNHCTDAHSCWNMDYEGGVCSIYFTGSTNCVMFDDPNCTGHAYRVMDTGTGLPHPASYRCARVN